jgi:hypothetical protein
MVGAVAGRRHQDHRERQGAILMLLLLGPAPISLLLVVLGDGNTAVAAVLAATATLVAVLLALYSRQRRDARLLGQPVLPLGQVLAMLAMLGGIGAGAFLLPAPSPSLAKVGLICVGLVVAIVYAVGLGIRRGLSEPDERCAVLLLGLMVGLIALANACV